MFDERIDDIQAATGKCPGEANKWLGDNPHANFEQSHPAVNKEEPAAFVNACESGAKLRSEDVQGKRMPTAGVYT
jgi:hypothetical protein